jgi:hypothetical protein
MASDRTMLFATPISDLSDWQSFFFVMLGVGGCVLAAVGKEFYWVRGWSGTSDKRAPTWFGRLLFGVIGVVFILAGLAHYFM